MGQFGSEERGPRRGSPLMMALIIAAMGLFMYFMQTEENPVTGEKQHISLTPDEEIRLGLQSAPEMASEMGGELPPSDFRTRKVQEIGQALATRTDARKGPWRFHYHLLKDPKTINAFALPGGQIFITLGLYNKLQNEAQLAGVLAHETGHVIERHGAEQMTKNQLGNILIMATAVGASDPSNPQRGQQAAMIATVVNQMSQLHYSRKDEYEADQWGLKLMAQIGYTPEAMLDVMEILKNAVPGGHQPEMLLTHPYPENRIEHIKQYLKEHPSSANLSEGNSLH